jgi:apolipoprotein N-acyltransferase
MDQNKSVVPAWALAGGAAVLAGLLFFFGTGEHPLWLLAWCGAFVVVFAAPKLPAAGAFAVGSLGWSLGCLNMWTYTLTILILPNAAHQLSWQSAPLAVLAFMIVPACAFGLAAVLFRACVLRGLLWQAVFVFPATWVSYEYISELLSPHSTFGNLAYSQMDVQWLVQLAAATGVWGISFFVLFMPAAAAVFFTTESVKQTRVIALVAGAAIVVVLAFGMWRLQPVSTRTASVRVALAASDARKNIDVQEPGAQIDRLLSDYEKPLATSGASVVVLPEKIGVMVPPTMRGDDALLQHFADKTRATVVAGFIRRSGAQRFNEARVYVPAGKKALTYDKRHLIPRFESRFSAGSSRTVLREPSGVWGVAVCKDMDFPALTRQYGGSGVALLLVPAWDFGGDAWLHDRMAIMRGVESGFSVARAAKEGLLSVSDDRGRVIAERSSAAVPMSTLVADVPVRHDDTLYLELGDWFAWLNLIVALAITIGLVADRLANPSLVED